MPVHVFSYTFCLLCFLKKCLQYENCGFLWLHITIAVNLPLSTSQCCLHTDADKHIMHNISLYVMLEKQKTAHKEGMRIKKSFKLENAA